MPPKVLADHPLLSEAASAAELRRAESANAPGVSPEAPTKLADFASESLAMRNLVELSRRVAAADSSLLILGETGVGKEWLARAIHAESPRHKAPFIAVNCAAIAESLLESELFGHEKGAFTGAVRTRRGYFELAHRGTLFLDEIGDMSPHLQVKLLRALQDRSIQHVGGETLIEVDVRIIAATNHNLEEAMEQKTFRRDLYYRLGVVTLTVPPLRERREDLPGLVHSYLGRLARRLGRPIGAIDDEAMAALFAYHWPGNVRELINILERAVLLCPGVTVTPEDLPEAVFRRPTRIRQTPPPQAAPERVITLPDGWLDLPLTELKRELADELERRYLRYHLEAAEGKIGAAAKRAGLAPRSLYEKMRALGMRKEEFRSPRPATGS